MERRLSKDESPDPVDALLARFDTDRDIAARQCETRMTTSFAATALDDNK